MFTNLLIFLTASLVVIAATLNQFNIPEAGLILLMGVDPFLDMGRSATNVMSNAIGAALVGRWEGEHYGDGCRGSAKECNQAEEVKDARGSKGVEEDDRIPQFVTEAEAK